MKRTTTEIFIEVEETVAFKTTERSSTRNANERPIELIMCPHCGNAIPDSRADTIKLLEEEK
jgi:hypothetical protein